MLEWLQDQPLLQHQSTSEERREPWPPDFHVGSECMKFMLCNLHTFSLSYILTIMFAWGTCTSWSILLQYITGCSQQ